MRSAVGDVERPAERVKLSCGSENSMGAPSTAAYSALLAERKESKSRSKALRLEDQCISGLAEETRELRARVPHIENSNAWAKSTSTRGQSKKRLTVAEKRVIAREAMLEKAQDAQKRSTNEAKNFCDACY